MESGDRSSSNSDSSYHRWANLLGSIMAVLTLTLPLLTIAYYSPFNSNAETIPQGIELLQLED